MMHGVKFTDRQLELVADERSVSGFRRLESAFDDDKTTASHPAYRPAAPHRAVRGLSPSPAAKASSPG